MKSELHRYLLFSIIFLFFFFIACRSDLPDKTPPEAVKGVLDLTDWDFKRDGPVDLNGEYEFYWKQHFKPSEFLKATPPQKTGFIRVPGYWNSCEIEEKKLSGDGYATYRLKILLNEHREPLALKIMEIGNAFTAYLNGESLCSVGVAGKNPETTIPLYVSQVADFENQTNQIEIIFQVSNFHHRRGGISEVVKIGREKDIREIRERKIGFELFLFGSIFIMALYHLGLFILRTKNRSPLYFGIFCFLIALRLLVTGERYFINLFPDTDWELMMKLEYSWYLSVPAFGMFMQSLFQEYSKRFCRLHVILGLAFSGAVLFTPARIFTHTLPVYEIITIIVMIYGFYALIISLVRKREGALVFFLGFIILVFTVVNDMLHVEKLIQTGLFGPFGLFIFIFSQSLLHSLRFSKAFTTIETQFKELRNTYQAYKNEITDHLQSEEALRESEEKHRTILQSIEDGYYEIDLAGNLTFFNDSMCRIVGYPKDELMGMNNREYMDEKTAKEAYKTFNEVYLTGKAVKSFDWEASKKDGTKRFLELSISVMRDSEGQPIGFRGIARDITERRQAEKQAKLHQQQLMQASKMVALGTLVSGVAHEVNNPNNFIMLNSPILLEAWQDAMPILDEYFKENGDFLLGGVKYSEMRNKYPELFSGISDGANRIKQIVDDLKNYIREDTTDFTQSVDINAVIKSAITLVANMVKKSTNHFSIDYGKNLPELKGNFQSLEQVIINLIQNACQAIKDTEKGLSVSTALGKDLSTIVVVIRDEGVGIPPEKLPHITDPFFTTKHDVGGVGLGLSISSKIVEEHGGAIRFTSQTNIGTTAEIILPINRG